MTVQKSTSTTSETGTHWPTEKTPSPSNNEALAYARGLADASKIHEILNPKKEPAPSRWTWMQTAKYSAYAAGGVALAYYGYTQLWDTVKKIPEIVKTAHTVLTQGIEPALKTANTAIDASQSLHHGIGHIVTATRAAAGTFVSTPPLPVGKTATIQVGTELTHNAWITALAAKANLIYLAPLSALSVAAYGLPSKNSYKAALGALVLETAVPGIVSKPMGSLIDNPVTETFSHYPKTTATVAGTAWWVFGNKLTALAAQASALATVSATAVITKLRACRL